MCRRGLAGPLPPSGCPGSQGTSEVERKENHTEWEQPSDFPLPMEGSRPYFCFTGILGLPFYTFLFMGADCPQCISTSRWRLRPRDSSKVWFPLLFHPLFISQEDLSFLFPTSKNYTFPTLASMRSKVISENGDPMNAPSRKYFPNTLRRTWSLW